MKKLTSSLLTFLLSFILLHPAFAQPTIEWQNTIGGSSSDEAKVVRSVPGGGYILAGTSRSGINGDKTEASIGDDYWIIKLNSTGAITWQNTIGGSGSDELTDVQPTADGGYIVAGYSQSGISGDKVEAKIGLADYWIVKLSSTGSIEWQNTIGGTDTDELMAVEQTSDGGYILGGSSESDVSGDKTEDALSNDLADYWIIKLNNTGTIQWQNTIGGSGADLLQTIHQTTDGGYILGGSSGSDISGDKTEDALSNDVSDYWIIKLDGAGNIEWQNTIGGSDHDELTALALTSDGGYILGGYSESGISGDKTETPIRDNDYWVVKINSAGNIIWQNSIGGDGDDYLRSIQQTTDGGYIIGGDSWSGSSGDKTEATIERIDYWIVKLNVNGVVEWDNTIGGFTDDFMKNIMQTADEGYILCGTSNSPIGADKTEAALGNDYWIIKLAPCASLLQFADDDGDGFGDPSNPFSAADCVLHDGYVFNSFDVVCTNEGPPEIQWQQTFGGSSDDLLRAGYETSDGGYIIGGSSASPMSGDKTEPCLGDNDYWIIKLNASGTVEWQQTIGGNYKDELYDIRETADGGYIACGNSSSPVSGDKTDNSLDTDYWILKLTSTGIIEWQASLGGNKVDQAHSIRQTPDGGYIVGGDSDSNSSGEKTEDKIGNEDYWVLKLSSTGSIEWQNTIGGDKDDRLIRVELTTDGGYILGGSSRSGLSGDKTESATSNNEFDYWVVKLNNSGNILWQNTIGSEGTDELQSLALTADGGYILGGYSDGTATGDKTVASHQYDYWMVKLNSSGVIEWEQTIGGSEDDFLGSVEQTTDEGFIIGGTSYSPVSFDKTIASIGASDYWLLKLSSTGTIEWQKVIGGIDEDWQASVRQTSDGGYFIGGYSRSESTGCKTDSNEGVWGSVDYWVIKLFPDAAAGCPLPQSVVISGITDTKATVSWLGNASAYSYRIRKRQVGTNTWIYSSVTAPTTSKILSGNIADTQYEVQVQTYCNPEKTDSSGYTASVFFTSDSECPKPKSVSVNDITDTKATVSWTGNDEAYSYRIRKRSVGTETWVYSSVTAPTTSKQLSNNIPTTDYEVQVQTYCDTSKTDSSGYTASVIFTTAGTCTGTTSQSTSNITATSAKLKWTYVSAPNKWTIKYRASGGDWITKKPGGNSTSFSLSNLTPATNYDWKIRAKCGSENSAWSPTQHFTTSPARLADENVFAEFSIYPNPAREELSIEFAIGKASNVSIKMYDVSGREVKTLVDGEMQPDVYSMNFNTVDLPKGIYLVRMISENEIRNQKLIIQ